MKLPQINGLLTDRTKDWRRNKRYRKCEVEENESGCMMVTEVVFAPDWWHANGEIDFDEDYFFNPERRVRDEMRMEEALRDRFGAWGLGADAGKALPQVGAVHLAAGFMLSEMLGCQVEYHADAPPSVHCRKDDFPHVDVEAAFSSSAFKRFVKLCDNLEQKFGYLTGDVNYSGVLNLALDLRGQELFIDMLEKPEAVRQFLSGIAEVIERFTDYVCRRTQSSGIAVNRTVRFFPGGMFLHSECSHTMIGNNEYNTFLVEFDRKWSRKYPSFGIHYCGVDPERYAKEFSDLPRLDFLDVGNGGDIAVLRTALPNTFLNLRLDPVGIINQSPDEIHRDIQTRLLAADNLNLTGICCVNMDKNVKDEQVIAILNHSGQET